MPICFILVSCVVLMLLICQKQSVEGFSYFKPGEIDRRVKILANPNNKKYFKPSGSYIHASTKWKWLDPLTYYDLADLYHKKKYTTANIHKLFEDTQ